jgi:hypothetical protein
MRAAGAGTYVVGGGYAWVNPYCGYATITLGKAGVRTAVALVHPGGQGGRHTRGQRPVNERLNL